MRNLLTFVLLWCTILSAYAQDVQIKGVVISGEDNLPLPGVNVVVKGTTIGSTVSFPLPHRQKVPSLFLTLVINRWNWLQMQQSPCELSCTKILRCWKRW